MEQIIDRLYYIELESGRLDPQNDPECNCDAQAFDECYDWLWEHLDHKKCEELYSAVMALLDSSDKAAFRLGLRLGLGLALWAGGAL